MKHKLQGRAETREVWLNGEKLDPKPSQKIRNHSPDGFAWGYNGSGPSQLALAIMYKLTGRTDGYHDFKSRVIAALPFGQDFNVEFEITEK